MHQPLAFLRSVARAVAHAEGPPFTPDAHAALARAVWDDWASRRGPAWRREALEKVACLSATDLAVYAAALAIEVEAPDPSALADYLVQVRAAVRQALRRPDAPDGTSLPEPMKVEQSADLAPFLPTHRARFRPGDRPLGDWELVELLGAGPRGETWKAWAPYLSSGPAVALRFCSAPAPPFAATLERARSDAVPPGIVGVRAVHLDSDPPCLESDFLPAGDLTALLRDGLHAPPLFADADAPARALQVTYTLRELAGTFAFLHALSPPLGHGQLAPGSLLVQRRPDGRLALRLTDLATALLSPEHTAPSPYASPQRLQGQLATPADDVYALGMIWLHLLTGAVGTDRLAPDQRTALVAEGLPGPVLDLLTNCIAEEADQRPTDAGELLRRLTELVGEPPPPPLHVSRSGAGHFRSIAAAIRAAVPGTRILVQPGVYSEPLVIDKAIEIIGVGPVSDVVVQGRDGDCVQVRTDFAVLRGLTLRNNDGRRIAAGAGLVVSSGRPVIADCDISSTSLACVIVTGAGSAPVFRRCALHDGKLHGLLVQDGAEGTFEDCDICGNALSGVEIKDGANPTLRRCRLRGGKQEGLLVHAGGQGLLEDCELRGNGKTGASIKRGGAPTLRRCRIHDNKAGGAFIYDGGKGLLEECDLAANAYAGVEVRDASEPVVRRCHIHDGRQGGIYIHSSARALFEECDIYANAYSGVEIKSGAQPILHRCQIHDGKQGGAYAHSGGQGLFTECDIFANAYAGVEVRDVSHPVLRHCRIHDGKQGGAYIHNNGQGTFEDCDIFANGRAGVAVKESGSPVLRRCRIHSGQVSGLHFYAGGKGLVEDCDIFGNVLSGLEVGERAAPTVLRCVLRDGKQAGAFFHASAEGHLENCEVRGNAYGGVTVASGANPVVRGCLIADNKQDGALVYGRGLGLFEDCVLRGNGLTGVKVKEEGAPTLLRCVVSANKREGASVHARGAGRFEDCAISANGRAGVAIREGGRPEVRRCRINDNEGAGAFVGAEGGGTVEECDLTNNKGGPWQFAEGEGTGLLHRMAQAVRHAVGAGEAGEPPAALVRMGNVD